MSSDIFTGGFTGFRASRSQAARLRDASSLVAGRTGFAVSAAEA